QLEQALGWLEQAAQVQADHAILQNNLGNILLALGRLEQAVAAFDRAVALKPDYAAAFHRRGVAREGLGRLEEALNDHARALALLPTLEPAAQAHAALQAQLGLGRTEAVAPAASSLMRKDVGASAEDNQKAAAQLLQSVQQLQAGQALPGAAASAQDAASAAQAHLLQAQALEDLQCFEQAAGEFEKALALLPDEEDLPGMVLQDLRQAAAWARLPEWQARIEAAMQQGRAAVSPLTWQAQSGDAASNRLCSSLAARRYLPAPAPLPAKKALSPGRIRIAYLSADYVQHAVMRVLAEVFELHDRSRFEIYAYAYGERQSGGMNERLRHAFEHYVDASAMSDEQAARHIHAQGIDIAVDLMGYTRGERLGILARRPAPIAVNYIGYPGTLCLPFIDYIVGDATLMPPELAPHYSEAIVRLPHCYLPTDRQRPIALPPPRQALGLPPDAFVFCAFSGNYKISPDIFAIWLRLLAAAPGSVLWLVKGSEDASANLRAQAQQAGIDPARLVFAERTRFDQYLARYTLADLFLDTLPYNALATASDALWAGLPVLTCTGQTYVGRGATSIVRAAGLPELATSTLAEYEALALRLATRPAELAALRLRLQQNRAACPLHDTPAYTRHLEAAYTRMAQRWQSGQPPQSFDVPA
ncbi:MAG: O-linked N-acetylglucosamine transferase, SPINDLY family protein, partial [Ottowia sp.]